MIIVTLTTPMCCWPNLRRPRHWIPMADIVGAKANVRALARQGSTFADIHQWLGWVIANGGNARYAGTVSTL